ncbi:cilia- and flagella-associated protein 251-like isoform X1 [Mytilus edulis]|uniref:cilia- and flagella-associated protein 251-like isoform X1 n=1 Tax=Mytilus edulis TaxID=6550 RepID=UPI0039EE915B
MADADKEIPTQEETVGDQKEPVQTPDAQTDANGGDKPQDEEEQKDKSIEQVGTSEEQKEDAQESSELKDDKTNEKQENDAQPEQTNEQLQDTDENKQQETTPEESQPQETTEKQEPQETTTESQPQEETTDTTAPTESQTLGNQTQSTRPSSASKKVPSPPPPTETGKTASIADTKTIDTVVIPEAPKIPSPDRPQSELEEKIATTALNIVWSFGLNRNIQVLNLTDDNRKLIMYACAHVGVLFDFENNRQHILQGHSNPLTCTCVSEDKRWLATGDKGVDSMVIIWDTYTGIPVQTIFDNDQDGGVVAMAMTPDARYLATLSSGPTQVLSIWNWTVDGESPMCTAELNPKFGLQNFILFNPDDIHYLVTNSESQVIFYHWNDGHMEYYAPPLTDQDFNKQVGRYSQSIFQRNSSRVLTATHIGNLVVWDNNKPLTKLVSSEPSADKKALKIIKLQDRGINVLTTTDKFIVLGDMAGHVKFFDQSLKLVHWYQDFHLGPATAISFAHYPDFQAVAKDGTNYPPDATIEARKFVIRDFVVGSSIAVFGNVTADGTKVDLIHREHDAAIHALSAHPTKPYLIIGSYAGLIKIWDYEKKQVVVTRQFERGCLIRCCAFDPKGQYIAIGFVNGQLRVVDSITLEDELSEPFRYARYAITHLAFSHDSQYLATASQATKDGEYTVSVYKRQRGVEVDPYVYLGRYRAHYKEIKDLMFGIHLDNNQPRLMSLGMDRVLVEYDLENSSKDDLKITSSDRIEQSAVPQCMTWYPPITKEHFVLTANDQYKFKLYNATTKMCRKTLLGPTYGTPVKRMEVVPTADPVKDKRYLAYVTTDKVGLSMLPLDGNPHNAMALITHPGGVENMVCSYDGKYLFTAGGGDATVHMWEINVSVLEAQSRLGGEDLIPFYGLLEGGRDGELFRELEDYFYYAQIRSQGVNAMDKREVSVKIPLSEVPFVMRAMGFYPSEQEIEDMLNEVKFSRYVETGQYIEDIDLGDFIKLYINHRPAFGLDPGKLLTAFETLGIQTSQGNAIERGDLLDMLQTKGEHMTEYELAEYLTTLLGFNAEGGSSELQEFEVNTAGDIIDQNLPHHITGEMFANEVLGFSMYNRELMSAGSET